MSDSLPDLARYRSTKCVQAGEITEVITNGCYVRDANGIATLRFFDPGMTVRYQPARGDFWIVYSDGYQSISPRQPFLEGYILLPQLERSDDP